MTKEELKEYKDNKDIKFIYKIPCSLYDEGFEYIIIGYNINIKKDNVKVFTIDDWFLLMKSGSILPYVCSILSKSGKIKEYINIYEKPNVLGLRRYINTLTNKKNLIQECLWGEQFIKEGRVNRIDVFKNKNNDVIDAINRFYNAVDPIYKMSLNERQK